MTKANRPNVFYFLNENDDIAVILLDVVMESEHAGLDLVQVIRDELNYKNTRIVLRTGQPGQAPEREVIVRYDINDYKSKVELTSQKLFTVMCASLRSYRDIVALEQSKIGLGKVIEASKGIFDKHAFSSFVSGALSQFIYLLNLDDAYLVSNAYKVYRFDSPDFDVFCGVRPDGVQEELDLASISDEQRDLLSLVIYG